MPKTIAIDQIEQQIESLPPVEQIMMLERIVRHLKKLLVAHPSPLVSRTKGNNITEKLNHVYPAETSCVEPQLFNAQLVSICQDKW